MLTVFLVALFAFGLGLALCFVGYRIFLVLLPIFGFFAGFWLGAEAMALLLGTGFLATTTGFVVGFVVGLLGAVLSYLFYLVGVALVAAGFGAALASGFLGALGLESGFLVTVVVVLAAVVVAVLTLGLNIQKYVIMALTAIAGANALLLSVLLLLGRVSLDSLQGAGNSIAPVLQDSWFWLIIWLVVAIAGFVVQIRTSRSYTFAHDEYVQDWG